jgi:hypothetical protein
MRPIAVAVLLTLWGAACGGARREGTDARPPGAVGDEDRARKAQLRPHQCPRDGTRERSAAAPANDLQVCPSAVAGASTRVDDVPGGVHIVVIASTGRAVREIRARAMRLTSDKLAAGDALGGGPSSCPIHYFPGTEATVRRVRGGVRFTVVARSADAVGVLRASVRQRAEAFTRPFVPMAVAVVPAGGL